jgi:FkbM family methyltransferase
VTFVSYAQNFEDVMLWRALKHIKSGFYVDVGAQDPVVDSVSLAFYEHGWRGVHIEPTPRYAEKLTKARTDETVIQAAVAATPGRMRFFEIPNTGLSTGDREIADRHRAQGLTVVETVVACLTLTQALVPFSGHDIHWMKIDVEGLERQVVEGWDGSLIRPWVLIIESTAPNTADQTHQDWGPLVLDRGYQFVYFDGLNRYYISDEHFELASSFEVPPNIFDSFVLGGKASHSFTSLVTAEVAMRGSEMECLKAQLNAIYASRSWRLTAPIRSGSLAARRITNALNPIKALLKVLLKPRGVLLWMSQKTRAVCAGLGRWVSDRPFLANRIKSSLHKHPLLARRLTWFVPRESWHLSYAQRRFQPNPSVAAASVSEGSRRLLIGSEADIDELMLRIGDEIERCRDHANT